VADFAIFEGDCREVMAGMDAESVDSIVTSPPYAMQRAKQYGGVPEKVYPHWTVEWMTEARRIVKDQGSVILNIREHVKDGQMSDYVHRTRMAIRESGWFEWDELIWAKTTSAPIGHPKRPRRSWERLLWFGKSRQGYADPKANGIASSRVGREGRFAVDQGWASPTTGKVREGVARCTDVCVAPTSRGKDHPAAFSVQLAAWCIRLVTPPGGLVLDPFNGSGSTGVAAVREGFTYLGIEQDPEYVEVSRRRIKEASNE
jgi:site-specific DNA-methyltransferase (adenine-specific)